MSFNCPVNEILEKISVQIRDYSNQFEYSTFSPLNSHMFEKWRTKLPYSKYIP